jgi:hypothetical protein
MSDMVQIRGWRQMWNDYIAEGLNQGLKLPEIKRNLIEAFRKEIFGQIMFRAKVADLADIPHDLKHDEMMRSIFMQEQKKWKQLVAECRKHLATAMLIKEDDLTLFDPPDEAEAAEEPEEEEEDDFNESDLQTDDPEEPARTGATLA